MKQKGQFSFDAIFAVITLVIFVIVLFSVINPLLDQTLFPILDNTENPIALAGTIKLFFQLMGFFIVIGFLIGLFKQFTGQNVIRTE